MLWWTLRRLRSYDPEVRRRAAAALRERRDVRTVSALLAALYDFSFEVRALAAQALGEIGDPRAVKPLVLVLKKWSRWERWAAIEALVKIGAAAVEPLGEPSRIMSRRCGRRRWTCSARSAVSVPSRSC
jgi:HEAT repeat protein